MKYLTQIVATASCLLLGSACMAQSTAIVRQDGQTGDDTYETIGAALAAAETFGYDDIVVYPGVYQEHIELNNLPPITIRSLDGPLLTCIDGSMEPGSNAAITMQPAQELTLIGLSIGGTGYGVEVPDSAKVLIRNCVISGNQNAGVYAEWTDNTLERTRISVINSVITNNGGDGLYFHVRENTTNTYYNDLFDISLQNNIIAANQGYGVQIYGRYDGPAGSSTGFLNKDRVSILYNLLNGNSAGEFDGNFATADPSSWELLISASNITNRVANLLDSATGCGADVRLRSISPAINAGNPGPQFRDPDGTRNDMGAFGGPNAEPYFTVVEDGPRVRDVEGPTTIRQSDRTFTIRAKAAIR